jgi:hypothetical protein
LDKYFNFVVDIAGDCLDCQDCNFVGGEEDLLIKIKTHIYYNIFVEMSTA